jgi:hypothetical protein
VGKLLITEDPEELEDQDELSPDVPSLFFSTIFSSPMDSVKLLVGDLPNAEGEGLDLGLLSVTETLYAVVLSFFYN